MCLLKVIKAIGVSASVLSWVAASATSPTSTQASEKENGEPNESDLQSSCDMDLVAYYLHESAFVEDTVVCYGVTEGLTWWQILLLVIGGFIVFTCWGCYFFMKHRENQQAKFKPVATANGDDPRVRSDSKTVKMESMDKSPDKPEHVDIKEELNDEDVNANPDKLVVAPDEIVIENVQESQQIASTSDYQPEQREIPTHVRCSGNSRYVAMDDDDLEYQ